MKHNTSLKSTPKNKTGDHVKARAKHRPKKNYPDETATLAVNVPMTRDSISREEIARLAYASWERRGRPDGSAEHDWFQAEKEFYSRLASGLTSTPTN